MERLLRVKVWNSKLKKLKDNEIQQHIDIRTSKIQMPSTEKSDLSATVSKSRSQSIGNVLH